jgi:hypothetical protein
MQLPIKEMGRTKVGEIVVVPTSIEYSYDSLISDPYCSGMSEKIIVIIELIT